MNLSNKDIRLLLLHEFRLGHTAVNATENLCISMGKGIVSYDTAKHWFREFKEGNFDLEDKTHPGRPVEVDLKVLKELIEEDPRLTARNLAEELGCSHVAVEKHLHELGKSWKYGAWIPHELNDNHLKKRVDACMELLTSHRNTEWLRNLITGDEKWVLYINYPHHRQWLGKHQTGLATPIGETHPKKIMLSVWWGIKGVIHWELLPPGKTITAHLYSEQLERVAEKLAGKQDRIYFLHDNAKPHIAGLTNKKLLKLGWTVLPHPPYSPDLAPTDYHLFRSLADHMTEKRFDNEDHLKSELTTFFSSKSSEFYESGILNLPKRWIQVIDNDGQYVDETKL